MRIGLVNRSVPRAALMPQTMVLAAQPPGAIRGCDAFLGKREPVFRGR